jgi:hypothetical protein
LTFDQVIIRVAAMMGRKVEYVMDRFSFDQIGAVYSTLFILGAEQNGLAPEETKTQTDEELKQLYPESFKGGKK